MPTVYWDLALRSDVEEGRTTFVVPTGSGTAFDGAKGISFREITDGISKTIVLAEVEPSKAVIWTQPADWEVDIHNPHNAIERTDRRYFLAGFADLHRDEISLNVRPNQLRALLTPAGHDNDEVP